MVFQFSRTAALHCHMLTLYTSVLCIPSIVFRLLCVHAHVHPVHETLYQYILPSHTQQKKNERRQSPPISSRKLSFYKSSIYHLHNSKWLIIFYYSASIDCPAYAIDSTNVMISRVKIDFFYCAYIPGGIFASCGKEQKHGCLTFRASVNILCLAIERHVLINQVSLLVGLRINNTYSMR